MLTIGERIRDFRRQKGWTQAGLAGRSGIPQPNLSRIEAGEQDPTVSTVLRICSALGVRPAEIFEDRPVPRPVRWTRNALERVAKAVVGSPGKLTEPEKEIVELLKDEIPGCRRRLSTKRIYQSWSELKRRLSREEIRTLLERIRDAEQRKHEKGRHSPVFQRA